MSVLIHLFPSPHTQFITLNTHSTVLLSSWWKTGTAQVASGKCLKSICFLNEEKDVLFEELTSEGTFQTLWKKLPVLGYASWKHPSEIKKDHPCHLLLTCLTKWYLYFHKHLMWQRFSERDLLGLITEQGGRLVILQICLLLSHNTAVCSTLCGAKCYQGSICLAKYNSLKWLTAFCFVLFMSVFAYSKW